MGGRRHATSRRRRAAAVAVAVVALSALTALSALIGALPAAAAGPPVRALGEGGWEARRLSRTVVPAAERDALARFPTSTRVAWHPGTHRVRFLAGTRRAPLAGPPKGLATAGALDTGDAVRAARAFLTGNGTLFGLARTDDELRLVGRPEPPPRGERRLGPSVRFAQVRDGLPVLGGEVVVQLGPGGEVLSAAGEALPAGARVATRPRLGAAAAARIAAAWLAREAGRAASRVATDVEGLAIHDARLVGGPLGRGPRLVWQVDARVARALDQPALDRLVLVDARHGGVVATIDRVADLDRRICDFANRPRFGFDCHPPYARREGQAPTGVADVDAAYRLMAEVDAWYRARFGRDGLDGHGEPMVATVRYCPGSGCPFSNAQWDWAPQQATFGRGWVTDDVVAHEFTHGLLDHEARLFYTYQSGAINESLADVFGELIDLAVPTGRDTARTRWRIGEDLPTGALRDMSDPPVFGDPDRMRSPLWRLGSDDDGGVHTNSGVGNKAAYLVAAGGSFNGFHVTGLGLERTARIWYRAMTAHLTSASDYLDLGDALVQSCLELVGSGGIASRDCDSVRAATRATEMNLLPRSGAPRQAPVCTGGRIAITVFSDDMEDASRGAWQAHRLGGRVRVWFYPPNPNNDPTWDGTWASSGELNLYGADRNKRTDEAMMLVAPVSLPKGAYLRFAHGYGFDEGARGFDGGVVEISLDGGRWRDLGSRFTNGGYTGRLARGRGDSLGGRRAFTGRSRGYGSSRVDLSDFHGHAARVRFRLATDRRVGGEGWYVDDVRIYRCFRDRERPTGSVVIDAGAATTSDPLVHLEVTAGDDSGVVARMLVSSSPTLADGRLAEGKNLDFTSALDWDLADPAWGGSADLGAKHVYVQVRDAAGRWSDVFSDEVELVASP